MNKEFQETAEVVNTLSNPAMNNNNKNQERNFTDFQALKSEFYNGAM